MTAGKTHYVGTLQRPNARPENVELIVDKRADITADEAAAGIKWVDSRYEPGNVLRYGAVGDGVTDDAAAFQAAVNVALQNAGEAYIPAGDYLISSTITCGRLKIRGDGPGSILIPTITDSSALFEVPTNIALFSFENFYINSNLSQTDFLSGAIDAQACTGIKVTSDDPTTFSTRYHMKNVVVRGCKIGCDINGFIGSIENLLITNCETALKGALLNSVRIHIRIENSRKDLEITTSNGVHFDQFLSQGGVLSSGVVTSTIDDCDGVTFTSPYLEQVRDVPFITFGATTECKGIFISGINIGVADNASADYEMYPLAFDQVNGLFVSGQFSTGGHHNFYSTTANTKNITDNSIGASVSMWGPHDTSKNIGPARNHFPNPNFDMWLRGFDAISSIRSSFAKETTLVRRGLNAIRVTMNASETNGYINFDFNDSYLGVQLAGKDVSLYAWIWIPNTADYDPNDTTSQLTQPSISITTNGTGGGTTSSGAHHNQRNVWNLFKVTAAIPSDCTRLQIRINMGTSGSSTGSEYLVIDSVYLIEGNLGQDVHIKNGWITDSDINPCKSVRGHMRVSASAAPTDTDQTYGVGDIVYDETPSTSGTIGWVCTTAGIGGTAVFKTFGTISA